MVRAQHRFLREVSTALGLPRTADRIVEVLSKARYHLSVAEISTRSRASERAVRQNLGLLLNRGLLSRRAVRTPQRKAAYRYSLRSVEELLAAARQNLRRTLKRLESAIRPRRVRA